MSKPFGLYIMVNSEMELYGIPNHRAQGSDGVKE